MTHSRCSSILVSHFYRPMNEHNTVHNVCSSMPNSSTRLWAQNRQVASLVRCMWWKRKINFQKKKNLIGIIIQKCKGLCRQCVITVDHTIDRVHQAVQWSWTAPGIQTAELIASLAWACCSSTHQSLAPADHTTPVTRKINYLPFHTLI